MMMRTVLLGLLMIWGSWETHVEAGDIVHPQRYTYELVAQYPHDERAFTQGLVYSEGKIYEGTGQYGRSELREVDLKTGGVVRLRKLPNECFGEGIAMYDGKLIQLTWQEQVAFVFRPSDFQHLATNRYAGEGWGITVMGDEYIVSDGTSTLRFYDAKTFRLLRRVKVRQSGRELSQLNELEYVDGVVYANVWHSDYIAMIDPKTGDVTGLIDLTNLNPTRGPLQFDREKCLNGIAYNETAGTLYVTGKNWPKLYEIRLNMQGGK